MSVWDHHMDNALVRLWADQSKSTEMIAKEINEEFPGYAFSKNAIVSRANRLIRHGRTDIEARGKAVPRRRLVLKKPRTPRKRTMSARVRPPVPVANDRPEPLNIACADLMAHHCRYIDGEPTDGFCGAPRWPGRPYCAYHSRIAYQPAHERRRQMKRTAAHV